MNFVLKNGRVIDPASQTDAVLDVHVQDGKIKAVGKSLNASEVIDATDRWILPGLVDVHVHLREPGQEYKEDIASGSRAAAAGGFTTIVAMPNTRPPIDNAELVQFVYQRSRQVGLCRVLPSGAITAGQKGENLAPMGEMQRAGAVAFTDDGHPVDDANLMRRALEYSQDFHLPILTHAECSHLSHGGHLHEGVISTQLGVQGVPRLSEDIAVARDIMLAEYTGGWLHVCHVSTAGAVELIRAAKKRGVRVTGEAAPHHFALTHEAVIGYQTFAKMNPPLREEHDRLAVIAGLKDGTLDCIATDHAPHSSLEKDVPFSEAAHGVIGLQTALPLSLQLFREGHMPLLDVIERLTSGPCRALNLPYGRLAVGAPADVVIVDPEKSWSFSSDVVLSKSHNSPFLDWTMQGAVRMTMLEGVIVHRN
jgi:dihydroorotase